MIHDISTMIYHNILNLGCDMGDCCFFPVRVEHAQCKHLGEDIVGEKLPKSLMLGLFGKLLGLLEYKPS